MHDDTTVCGSTTVAGFTEKVVKLPPGGGRAARRAAPQASAAGASKPEASPPKGSVHVTVTYLGGPNCRYRLQVGKRVRYIEGLICLHDAINCVTGKHDNRHR